MKLYLKYIAAMLLMALTSGCTTDDLNKEKLAVRNCFEDYRTAIINMNGEAAYSYLNRYSKSSYSKLLQICRDYDSVKLVKENAGIIFYVLTTRMGWDADTLMKVDTKTFFIASVMNNTSNTENLKNMNPKVVDVSGKKATISVTTGSGAFMKNAYYFSKENGQWKIDIFKTLEKIFESIKKAAKDKGKTEREMLYEVIKSATGAEVTDKAWIPASRIATAEEQLFK